MPINTNTVPSTVQLTDLVAKFKVIARDSLRAKLVSARQSRIASLKAKVADVTAYIADLNHEILVENYEISVSDKNHPNYATIVAKKAAVVVDLTAEVKNLTENDLVELNKAIDEQTAGIAAIQSGETKVSLEELNELVDKMLVQYAKDGAVL